MLIAPSLGVELQACLLYFVWILSWLCLCRLVCAMIISMSSLAQLTYSAQKTVFLWSPSSPLVLAAFLSCLSQRFRSTVGRDVIQTSHLELSLSWSPILCMLASCGLCVKRPPTARRSSLMRVKICSDLCM